MLYKTDWPGAEERWIALWEGRHLDRPVITVTAPNGKPPNIPRPVSGEQKWLDPEFITRAALATFETTHYGGEAFPSCLNMAVWVLNTYGARPRFPLETIWFDPIPVNWDVPPGLEPDFESPWFHKVKAVHLALMAAAGYDNFLVGHIGPMMANDLLAFVIGTETLLTGMVDHPAWVKAALRKLTDNLILFTRHFQELTRATHRFWYGNPGWMPFWGPELFVPYQSDLSCMLSPDMFETFIVPELEACGRAFGGLWYHLDGQTAFQHVPRLLAMPFIKVVQFTPMPNTGGNGPAYLDLYKRIQAAGKIVHIEVHARADVIEPLARQLDPGRLCMDTRCDSIREADELLGAVERWTRARCAAR